MFCEVVPVFLFQECWLFFVCLFLLFWHLALLSSRIAICTWAQHTGLCVCNVWYLEETWVLSLWKMKRSLLELCLMLFPPRFVCAFVHLDALVLPCKTAVPLQYTNLSFAVWFQVTYWYRLQASFCINSFSICVSKTCSWMAFPLSV